MHSPCTVSKQSLHFSKTIRATRHACHGFREMVCKTRCSHDTKRFVKSGVKHITFSLYQKLILISSYSHPLEIPAQILFSVVLLSSMQKKCEEIFPFPVNFLFCSFPLVLILSGLHLPSFRVKLRELQLTVAWTQRLLVYEQRNNTPIVKS